MIVMTGRIEKYSVLLLAGIACVAAFLAEWRFPAGVLIGGGICLLSYLIIVWSVRRFVGLPMAQVVIMGVSLLKITVVCLLLVILSHFRVINIFGLVLGFTTVLGIILLEGYRFARRNS